ncbi:hypothetical protein AGDE_16224 [Angomonas deanei]|uniref:Uncharacterized protein n=1 Tax=Angomonas deanei TaxID=59799 RepID=A0A7G2C6K8_9TRYP|nr:hypothetical protein AGDE_16224 [Angomonas deanei]CAD2213592.1 hypothetical protein, conserved [Angomonas deanei]|eukprot:EPY17499.1 hypothetical protein AGDE_16224 [Angomonas deanei]
MGASASIDKEGTSKRLINYNSDGEEIKVKNRRELVSRTKKYSKDETANVVRSFNTMGQIVSNNRAPRSATPQQTAIPGYSVKPLYYKHPVTKKKEVWLPQHPTVGPQPDIYAPRVKDRYGRNVLQLAETSADQIDDSQVMKVTLRYRDIRHVESPVRQPQARRKK